jgi:serine/threonine protein kinase
MEIIQRGKWGNSNVYLHEHGANKFVVKTFAHHPLIIKHTIGRFLISREYKALKKLSSCMGTCDNIIKLGKFSLSYKYVKGQNLSSFSRRNNTIDKKFFINFEKAVKEMHSLGIVHLDLRTGSNVIISEKGEPLIIDFNSYLNLNMIPGKYLKNLLKSVDLSGVYKYWIKMNPETLEESKKNQLSTSNKQRKLWFLKGYMLQNIIKDKKKKSALRKIQAENQGKGV